MVYTTQGQPAVYSELSVVLFVNPYLTVLAEASEDTKAQVTTPPRTYGGRREEYGITTQCGCNT